VKTIELTEEEMTKLNDGDRVYLGGETEISIKKKVEQWKPKENGNYNINDYLPFDAAYLVMLRDTEEQAKEATKKMRTFNRLLAYVDEFDSEDSDKHYTISYCPNLKKYDTAYHVEVTKLVSAVYMSRDVAYELCRKLNSGEVCMD
jgi:hypothetical protein